VITLTELRPGAIFGELAMFGGETRSASVEVLEPMRAVAILASDLRRLILRHPDIAVKMLEGLAHRLRAANERIARQSFQTAAGRCAAAGSGTSGCWLRWERSLASGFWRPSFVPRPTATARSRSPRGRRCRSRGSLRA